jgi:hypothetical protein
MIPIAMTLLLIAGSALLLILPVYHCLIDHVALLLVNCPAPLLTAGVIHSTASGLCKFIAMLLVPNVLKKKHFK